MKDRCGTCQNCVELEQIQRRVLACCNPPFSHVNQDVIEFWNQNLKDLPCTGKNEEDS